MNDLQRMAEQRAPHPDRVSNRSTTKDTFLATAAAYQHMFGLPLDADDTARDDSVLPSAISATFEVIFLMGWAPSDSQPKPLKRGSADTKISHVVQSSSIEP
mmetsp:Transcript_11083/g.16629  ORF Transcript_11083/g.16629 Transcript_11083/m.16629 type:complete len:102 (-) Transcript_11083:1125-1430(-)